MPRNKPRRQPRRPISNHVAATFGGIVGQRQTRAHEHTHKQTSGVTANRLTFKLKAVSKDSSETSKKYFAKATLRSAGVSGSRSGTSAHGNPAKKLTNRRCTSPATHKTESLAESLKSAGHSPTGSPIACSRTSHIPRDLSTQRTIGAGILPNRIRFHKNRNARYRLATTSWDCHPLPLRPKAR